MNWESFLKKRADADLSDYSDSEFECHIDKRYKEFCYIQIKDGNGKIIQNNQNKDVKILADERVGYLKNILSLLDISKIGDVLIPLYIADSYAYEYSNIHFDWVKPQHKKGLLFPVWTFWNWDKTKEIFENSYIPWTDREPGPYFVGSDTTSPRSKIREIVKSFYPDTVKLARSREEWRKNYEPVTNILKYKVVFDLPGTKPWSVRTSLIALSGSYSVRILNYYPKWGEGPWFQFFEDPDELMNTGIHITGNYDRPIPKEAIPTLKERIDDEIKHGLKRWNTAKSIKNKMMKLTEKDMLNYLEYILSKVSEKQMKFY